MNLYGFATGDPVNYSDPFGLFECSRNKPEDCTLADVGRNVLAGMASVSSPEGGADTGPGFKIGRFLGLLGFALPAQGAAAAAVDATAATREAVLEGALRAQKPGYQLGVATRAQFDEIATAFAGSGSRLSRSGNALVSADGLYVVKLPMAKSYGGPTSRVVGNLVVKNAAGQEVINAHIPILFGPAH